MNRYSFFVQDIQSSGIDPDSYLALACGSSLTEEKARDTDIFIYSSGSERSFSEELFKFLSIKDQKSYLRYLKDLNFYSIKYVSGNQPYSIHIASKQTILSYIDMSSHVETYTDINIFEVRLNPQTVYRKWIMDTLPLCGDISLKELFVKRLRDMQSFVPYEEARKELVSRIRNNVKYFYEKADSSELTCNVLLCQIVNHLINYCYLVNNQYYGTVKYIKDDLSGFEIKPELARAAIEIMESLNKKDISFFYFLLDKMIYNMSSGD